MARLIRAISAVTILVVVVSATGCRATGRLSGGGLPVRAVRCLFDPRPWLNLDAAGDREPEGLQYRAFLDVGKDKGVLRDGTFRIELYRIDHAAPKESERTLVSDWEYPTSSFQPVKSRFLGMGYHIRLRWARKDVAGHEIEILTQYQAPDGRTVRSGTKRLRVPTY